MKLQRLTINPLLAFIGIQCAWIAVVAFWIYWFLGSHRKFRTIAEKYSPELLQPGIDWLILLEGLLLLIVILVGVYVIFLYWRRQLALNREQKSFISQVTHELKSPVASLQLHLETIRRHPLEREQLDQFVGTMLADTERLNSLISKLLTANRLEQSRWRLALRPTNLSEFLLQSASEWQSQQTRPFHLTTEIEPQVQVDLEPETFGIILRNLLENALLYSESPAQIALRLTTSPGHAVLTVADRGHGIPAAEQKKIFRMFYRRAQEDSRVKGFGLGLFIVRALVKRHKGRITLESAGHNQGSTFTIRLPLVARMQERT
ncbi:MAG: HAMP domain-containing histidine kinase [Desulfuromonadaceae bacterium]|nr:HAMP domain-containing histidine kinase [Desulfuromonadaceae bacterium]